MAELNAMVDACDAEDDTRRISLHPEGDKTRVRLVHRGLPEDAISDHGTGWAHYLRRLAITAIGGKAGADVAPSND